MKNHEKSKKHREMVALLRQQLKQEEESLGLNGTEREGGNEDHKPEEVEEEEEEEEEKPRQKYEASVGCDSRKKQLLVNSYFSFLFLLTFFFSPAQAVQKTKEEEETEGSCTRESFIYLFVCLFIK